MSSLLSSDFQKAVTDYDRALFVCLCVCVCVCVCVLHGICCIVYMYVTLCMIVVCYWF